MFGSILLSACGSLLEQAEKAVQEDYGPQYSALEHHTRTYDTAWRYIEENYVYYESAGVDWGTIRKDYASQITEDMTNEQFNELMHGLEDKLPEGAFFYESRAERIQSDLTDFSTYEGIGAIIGFQKEEVPHVVILDVLENSPAEQAGLKPHDSIFEIDGNPILLEEGLDVVNRIRGPAGSTVTLNVKTPGKNERSIQVTRGKLVSTGDLEAGIISGTSYGYILLPPITYNTMPDDVRKILAGFSTQKFEGLILDLRISSSSRGFPLEELLTLFGNGTAGEFYNRANETQSIQIKGENYFDSQTVPLVILIGANTSGSPEIFAGNLQAKKRATIVGETSPGSIESTSSFYLPDGSRIFIETVSFRLSDGSEIGSNGIKPDVMLDAGWDDVLPNNDPVIKKAIDVLSEKK
jgi:carboxyl-terminal processing protease